MPEISIRINYNPLSLIELKAMAEKGTPLELPVLEANRGGLILETHGVKGFLPASQLSSKNYPRVEGGDKGTTVASRRKSLHCGGSGL